MSIYILLLIVALIWNLACGPVDAYFSNKGIRAGVAVEGNPIINKLFGFTPSAKVLYLFNVVQSIVLVIPGVILATRVSETKQLMSAVSFGALVADGAHHLYSAYLWYKLLKGAKH